MELLNNRIVLQVSTAMKDAVEEYSWRYRIRSLSDAYRQLIQAGLDAANPAEASARDAVPVDVQPLTFPEPGKLVAQHALAHQMIPALRDSGRREVTPGELVELSIAPEYRNAGSEKAAERLLIALGWIVARSARASRDRLYRAPSL